MSAICGRCNGSGQSFTGRAHSCPECRGTGEWPEPLKEFAGGARNPGRFTSSYLRELVRHARGFDGCTEILRVSDQTCRDLELPPGEWCAQCVMMELAAYAAGA